MGESLLILLMLTFLSYSIYAILFSKNILVQDHLGPTNGFEMLSMPKVIWVGITISGEIFGGIFRALIP